MLTIRIGENSMTSNKTLGLDPQHKKFLGVCAGLARFLGVEPWTVRLVFIGCVLFGGWFLLPMYFACWFLMDDASQGIRNSLADNLAVKHFRTVDYRKKIYRNTRDAKWLGICAGIADYLEINVFAVRITFLLLFFTTGGFPFIFYMAAWMVLDKAPDSAYLTGPKVKEQGSVQSKTAGNTDKSYSKGKEKSRASTAEDLQEELHSKRREFKFCARKFLILQARLTRMEEYVTSSRFKLHREFRNIS